MPKTGGRFGAILLDGNCVLAWYAWLLGRLWACCVGRGASFLLFKRVIEMATVWLTNKGLPGLGRFFPYLLSFTLLCYASRPALWSMLYSSTVKWDNIHGARLSCTGSVDRTNDLF